MRQMEVVDEVLREWGTTTLAGLSLVLSTICFLVVSVSQTGVDSASSSSFSARRF